MSDEEDSIKGSFLFLLPASFFDLGGWIFLFLVVGDIANVGLTKFITQINQPK